MSNEEEKSVEERMAAQLLKTQVLTEVKAYAGSDTKEPVSFMPEQVLTLGEYILYLENQVEGYLADINIPPSPRQKDWVQKDIQIIMRDSGIDKFLEDAQIINLSGRVLVHRSERAFIKCILDEAPENMKFTLIEEMPRTQKKVTSVTTGERNITITFDDGSSQSVPITKEETSEEWD